MQKLDHLLCHIEQNIDLDHIKMVEKLHIGAIAYKEIPFLPLSVLYPLDEKWIRYPYQEAYDDPEKMLYNELLWSFSSIVNSVKLKDHFPLQIRSNHGVGIIASMFGANCRIVNNNMPWVDHFTGIKDIKNLIVKGIPAFTSGLGGKVIQTHKYYMNRLKDYPKCFEAIHVTQPDLQGPFDIAHLLFGNQIFYEVFDNPKIVHQLLDLITQTYIGFREYIDPLLTDYAGENAVYVHGSIYGGKVVIKDDTAAINLSEDMYNEFSKQYNQRIFEEFKGGTLHHCGQERKWHFQSFTHPWLRGINYGNPEMHDIEVVYSFWKKTETPIIWWGYNQKRDYLDQFYRTEISTGVSLAVNAESYTQAIDILETHTQK